MSTSNKLPRKRIAKFNNRDNVRKSSKLRQLWAECGYCAQTVRLHLMRMESKGEKINI